MDAGGFGQPGANAKAEYTAMAAAAEIGPQLATVAISGVIHIYNPPGQVEEPDEGNPVPAANPTPSASGESPSAEQPASVPAMPAEEANPESPSAETPANPEAPNSAPDSETPATPADSTSSATGEAQ